MEIFIVIVLCILHGGLTSGYDFKVNMEQSSVCTMGSVVRVSPYDTASIFAEPLPISKPTRSDCAVKFISTNGDGFKIFVRDLIFGECEVYVKIYEDQYLNTAKHSFGCRTNMGGLYRTMANTIIVRLEKPGPESHSYKFYLKLALNDGPDIGGEEGGDRDVDTEAMGTGVIIGIVIACLVGGGVAIAVIVYCVITWRNKKEEKELMMSMSTVFPTGRTETDHRDGGGSVHSSSHVSWHSSKIPSENPAYNYPAYRTQASISEKAPKCNSIDTKSDSENTDGSRLIGNKKPKVKSAKKELDSLRRTIFRIEKDAERDKEEELRYLERERDRKGNYDDGYHDDPYMDRRDRGLTSGRHGYNNAALTSANIKQSLRSARERGRSFGSDGNVHKSSRSGRSHSSRSRHKGRSHSPARSNASSRDWDSYSDRYARSHDRHDSKSKSGHRSSSVSSRRHREDRDYYSDYDYETRDSRDNRRSKYRDRDRDAYSEEYSDDERYSHKSYRSEGHRARSGSQGQRSRSGSTGRRRRQY